MIYRHWFIFVLFCFAPITHTSVLRMRCVDNIQLDNGNRSMLADEEVRLSNLQKKLVRVKREKAALEQQIKTEENSIRALQEKIQNQETKQDDGDGALEEGSEEGSCGDLVDLAAQAEETGDFL
mmetsp:Transcript_19668/g.28430  ORF Transcript_19668/g.28430 Transcript_19668/m.28430 type:complete len:124 (+) Transcript_19668:518-889(+)